VGLMKPRGTEVGGSPLVWVVRSDLFHLGFKLGLFFCLFLEFLGLAQDTQRILLTLTIALWHCRLHETADLLTEVLHLEWDLTH
jgi:hypothetical protein